MNLVKSFELLQYVKPAFLFIMYEIMYYIIIILKIVCH